MGHAEHDRDIPTYALENPADGSQAAAVPDLRVDDVDERVEASRQAYRVWRDTRPDERTSLLRDLAAAVRRDVDHIAGLETVSNGKPLRQTRGETLKAAAILEHAAGLTSHIGGRTIPLGGERTALTFEEPIGVVAVFVPWNSPLIIAAMSIGPALAAGCTVLIKPSPVTPLEAMHLAELCTEVGFPDGVVQTVTGSSVEVGERLVEHPAVAKIVFTGSTAVGRQIAASAGRHLKSVLLELGGKGPIGVFPDADLDQAAVGVAEGVILSAGQSCVTPSRLLVHESIVDEVIQRVRARVQRTVMGPPTDPDTEVGPLASADHQGRVRGFVERARQDGCEVSVSYPESGALPSEGYYHPITVLRVPHLDVEIWRDEVFGPVLAWTTFGSEDEFLEIANDTEFGLGAVAWTNDYRRVLRLANRLEAGMVWINSQRTTEIGAPFGGVKASGMGRQNGTEVLREFLVTKTLYLGMH